MQGVINIYKEKGYTSFHVVAILRRLTGEKKIGHTGTLDPDATGVLPVCIGKATKLVGRLTDTDKTYRTVMLLGKKTDTQDISGTVLEEMSASDVRSRVSEELIIRAFEHFTGQIEQIPPMYSAVKVDGVKLVDAARKGRVIERESRSVTVYGYEDIRTDFDLLEISFTVYCSKGTYVRTICEDIGAFMGIPACMKELERIRAAGLGTDSAITVDEVIKYAEQGTISEYIIPTDHFLMEYPYLTVNDEAVKRLVYGNYLYEEDFDVPAVQTDSGLKGQMNTEGIYRIYTTAGEFYALYRYDSEESCYKCEKMFK